MGIDANIHVEVELTPEELAKVNTDLKEAFAVAPDNNWFQLEFCSWDYNDNEGWFGQPKPAPRYGNLIRLSHGARYYGHHYERGPWPHIYAILRWLQLKFPGKRVFYNGDGNDFLSEYNESVGSDLWEHFVKHGFKPYRDKDYRKKVDV